MVELDGGDGYSRLLRRAEGGNGRRNERSSCRMDGNVSLNGNMLYVNLYIGSVFG